MDWLDRYEIRARIAPSIIISLPIAISIFSITSILSKEFAQLIIGGGFTLIVFSYMLSFLIRYYGRELERDLWSNWDGAPSTRFIRWKDSTLGYDIKKQLHDAVENSCKIKLSSPEQEIHDPKKADELIEQAFLQVKEIVRQDYPDGIWVKHSAEYGFHRNLLGSRRVWLLFAIFGIIACGIAVIILKNNNLVIGLILNVLLALISIAGGWYYLPIIIKNTADIYSKSVWISFLTAHKREPYSKCQN